jgi:hypothetical protein
VTAVSSFLWYGAFTAKFFFGAAAPTGLPPELDCATVLFALLNPNGTLGVS